MLLYFMPFYLTLLTKCSLNQLAVHNTCLLTYFLTSLQLSDIPLRVPMFTLQTRKSIFQVMQSLDDGLTRPASSTSPTLGGIFTSKSTYSNVRIFYVLLPSLTLTQYGDGDQYFYQDTSLGDCRPGLKSNSSAYEIRLHPARQTGPYQQPWSRRIHSLMYQCPLGALSRFKIFVDNRKFPTTTIPTY